MIEAQLPPRIKQLMSWMAKTLPCKPDTPEMRAELQAHPPADLLHIFLNWSDRMVAVRKRSVEYTHNFWDQRGLAYIAEILKIADKIKKGEDICRHLSDKIAEYGYTPARYDKQGRKKGPNWDNKDFALNTYDVHHLHLSSNVKESGWTERGRDLLYVNFSREIATFLMIGDHKSFDDGSLARTTAAWRGNGQVQTPYSDQERNILHRAGISTLEVVDGKIYIGTDISSDGSLNPKYTQHLIRTLKHFDQSLEDSTWAPKLFSDHKIPIGPEPNFEWQIRCSELVLVETRSNRGLHFTRWRR